MAEARKVQFKELSSIVSDAEELSKGARLFDDKALAHLARFENKLFAEAKGSGSAPYKVQILLDDKPKGRCSCMAARSRPFCKHAAALLVAWSRAPEGFVVSDVAPAGVGAEAKKREVKKGKVDAAELMKGGVEQVSTLVRELALSGVAAISKDRVGQLRALGEGLRESRLRRLSARTIALSEAVETAVNDHESFDASAYAELVSDAVLTVRKLEKHLAGEVLEDKYVEELIGKTWTKKDRKPIAGLKLIEYAFLSRTTADDFIIRESRFLDAGTGEHFSEKQIIPGFLAARTEAKKSRAGWYLEGAEGSVYPSFAPVRVDLESSGNQQPLADASLEQLASVCLPTVTAALQAFQERRKDVFAPDTLPVALLVDAVLAEGVRMQVVDQQGGALFLAEDPTLDESLGGALRGVTLKALFGDVTLEGALPTLYPLAALVKTEAGLALRPLGAADANAIRETRKVKLSAGAKRKVGAHATSWVDIARAVGISSAAVALGELREELAQSLVTGLASVTPRLTDPLVARLKELGLEKQGALLDATAKKPDPADRLDDLVKLYKVLGIALTRLTGAAHVDRGSLMQVPTFESVHVKKLEGREEPRVTAERVGKGELNRYQAAARYAAWFDEVPREELAQNIYPLWADGSASHFIARVFAKQPKEAVAAAKRALGLGLTQTASRWQRPKARMVQHTALRVLEAVGGLEAEQVLQEVSVRQKSLDPTIAALAQRVLRRLEQRRGKAVFANDERERKEADELCAQLLNATQRETRMRAAHELASRGWVEAIPVLRASMQGDVSSDVRECSAHVLGMLGDAESADRFITLLRHRNDDPEAAKVAAYVLGGLGDVRGVPVLVDAWQEAWKPGVVSEALRHVGTAALEEMVRRIESDPSLLKRAATATVLSAVPAEELATMLCARLEELKDEADFIERANVIVSLASVKGVQGHSVVKKLLELRPALDGPTASKAEKALFKKCGAAGRHP